MVLIKCVFKNIWIEKKVILSYVLILFFWVGCCWRCFKDLNCVSFISLCNFDIRIYLL